MTTRKKKGVGYFITGGVFVIAGFIYSTMEADPTWLATAVTLVGIIAEFLGFKTVYPDVE